MPATATPIGGEVYEPFALTVAVTTSGSVEHEVSPGKYRSKVIVPVGSNPPASVTVSVTCPPIVADVAVLAIVGVAGATATLSAASPQEVVAAVLLASPP
jgi:hypothetical protein